MKKGKKDQKLSTVGSSFGLNVSIQGVKLVLSIDKGRS